MINLTKADSPAGRIEHAKRLIQAAREARVGDDARTQLIQDQIDMSRRINEAAVDFIHLIDGMGDSDGASHA